MKRVYVLLAGLVLTGVGIAAGELVNERYRLAYDSADEPCLPYRLYAVQLGRVAPERGQLVVFDAAGLSEHFEGQPSFTKQVAGLPGDRIRVNRAGVWINERFIGALNPDVMHRAGVTLADVVREEVVPDGKMFVVGTEPRAFDSRYYGLVPLARITGTARPLW